MTDPHSHIVDAGCATRGFGSMQGSRRATFVGDGSDPSPLVFWLVLLATWALSFAGQHDLFFALEGNEATGAELADAVTDGSVFRRVALPMLAVVGALCTVRYARSRLHFDGIVGWTWLAFLAWAALSVIWSDDPALSGRRLVALACLLMGALGIAAVAFDRLPTYVATFCGLNLLIGLLAEGALGTFSPGSAGYRFGGTIHPNLQGLNLAMMVIACTWLIWDGRRNERRLGACGLFAGLLFLPLTQSRTSIGALMVTLLFTIAIRVVRRHGLPTLAPPVVAATLVSLPLLLVGALDPDTSLSSLAASVISTERDLGDPASLTGRTDLWPTLLDYASRRPLLGTGHDAFWSAGRIEEISLEHGWAINQAHNGYLEWLLNLGVIGLALYVVTIVSAWLGSSRQYLDGRDAYGIAASLMVFNLLHCFLESIQALPTFGGFLVFVVLFHIGFLQRAPEHD